MKILHIINSLGNGGAEKNLVRLIENDKKNSHEIIILKTNNFYSNILKKTDTKIYTLNLSLNKNLLNAFRKMHKIIKKNNSSFVMCWMYHACIVGSILYLFNIKINLIWNIRHSSFKIGKSKLSTIFLARVIMPFFHLVPKAIVYNSKYSLKVHNFFFYFNKKNTVIHNGFSIPEKFFKKNLFVKNNLIKIGFIGRYNHQKNHYFFFNFLSLLDEKKINFSAYLVGNGINKNNSSLNYIIKKFDLKNKIFFLKEKNNINEYYQNFDIVISTSFYGESFPNILAESMINRTICLAPNIGENKFIIKNKNLIYERNNINDLLYKFQKITNIKNKKKRKLISEQLFKRAKNKLTMKNMIYKYNKLFKSL